MDWLTYIASLHGRLTHGRVESFVTRPSRNFTAQLRTWTGSRPPTVTTSKHGAARRPHKHGADGCDKVDVRQCFIPPDLTGPEWVHAFVEKRRGPNLIRGLAGGRPALVTWTATCFSTAETGGFRPTHRAITIGGSRLSDTSQFGIFEGAQIKRTAW